MDSGLRPSAGRNGEDNAGKAIRNGLGTERPRRGDYGAPRKAMGAAVPWRSPLKVQLALIGRDTEGDRAGRRPKSAEWRRGDRRAWT